MFVLLNRSKYAKTNVTIKKSGLLFALIEFSAVVSRNYGRCKRYARWRRGSPLLSNFIAKSANEAFDHKHITNNMYKVFKEDQQINTFKSCTMVVCIYTICIVNLTFKDYLKQFVDEERSSQNVSLILM